MPIGLSLFLLIVKLLVCLRNESVRSMKRTSVESGARLSAPEQRSFGSVWRRTKCA